MRPTAALTEWRKGRPRGDVGRPLDCCACGGLCWPTGRMGPFQWGSNVLKLPCAGQVTNQSQRAWGAEDVDVGLSQHWRMSISCRHEFYVV